MNEMASSVTPKEILREFKYYENPPVSSDTDIVWVVSGHDAFDGTPATSTYSEQYLGQDYKGEDRQRILKGVELVQTITAERLNKDFSAVTQEDIQSHGPLFFYNGVFVQNETLRNATLSDFPLPKNRVLISEITPHRDPTPQQANTKTQFEKFPHDLLEKLVATGAKMAIVSHSYHMSRIRRQVQAPILVKEEPLWTKIKVDFFVADELKKGKDKTKRQKNAAFLLKTIKGETAKINTYSKKGDLTLKPEPNS